MARTSAAAHTAAVSANVECRWLTGWIRQHQVERLIAELHTVEADTACPPSQRLNIGDALAGFFTAKSSGTAAPMEAICGWVGDVEIIDDQWTCGGCGAVHEVDPDFLDRP